MKFTEWLDKNLWYHGTRRKLADLGGDKQGFGGIHLGTKKAAMERLENTPSQRTPAGGRPGPAKIYSFRVNLKKPYNSPDTPVSEHDLFLWLNTPNDEEWKQIKNNYDGLYYRNNIEDAGSISLLVFSTNSLTLAGEEDVIA